MKRKSFLKSLLAILFTPKIEGVILKIPSDPFLERDNILKAGMCSLFRGGSKSITPTKDGVMLLRPSGHLAWYRDRDMDRDWHHDPKLDLPGREAFISIQNGSEFLKDINRFRAKCGMAPVIASDKS